MITGHGRRVVRRSVIVAAAIGLAIALYLGLRYLPIGAPDETSRPNFAIAGRDTCAKDGDPDRFFPPTSFRPWDDVYLDAPRIYYSLFLTAMREPSLSCGSSLAEAYRVLRVERNGVPLAVRVERRGARATVTWVKLEAPAWALPPNGIMAQGAREISDAELALIRSAFAASDLWNLPVEDPSPGSTSTDWLLEGRIGSRYRVVVRRASPGAYRAAGLVLMEVAGIGESELAPDAPGVTFRPRRPQSIPGLPPPPQPPPDDVPPPAR